MTELRPCPWCGCEAELHETTDGWIAACGSEQSVLDGLTHKAHAYGATEAEAAEAWNARAERTCRNDDGWCSECEHFLHNGFKWCPWCGAKVVDE